MSIQGASKSTVAAPCAPGTLGVYPTAVLQRLKVRAE